MRGMLYTSPGVLHAYDAWRYAMLRASILHRGAPDVAFQIISLPEPTTLYVASEEPGSVAQGIVTSSRAIRIEGFGKLAICVDTSPDWYCPVPQETWRRWLYLAGDGSVATPQPSYSELRALIALLLRGRLRELKGERLLKSRPWCPTCGRDLDSCAACNEAFKDRDRPIGDGT